MGFGSPWHWIVIGIVALLLFGNRLPEVARSMGKALREFKRGLSDMSEEIDHAGHKDDRPHEKLSPPNERRESERFNSPENAEPREHSTSESHKADE